MVQIDISLPQSCDDCPFLLVDYKTNIPDCDLMEDMPNSPEYDWNTPMGQRDKNCPLKDGGHMSVINWQYTKDPNDINTAIRNNDRDWEGLTSADQIINITFDSNHGCYVVFWRMSEEKRKEDA